MKKKVYGLVGIAALAAVGGTFAYFSASETFTNPFQTTNFGTSSTEKFNPSEGDNWKPGQEVDKEVFAQNTGDGLVWVRVKFDEEWNREGEEAFGKWNSAQNVFFPNGADKAESGEDDQNYQDHQPGSGEEDDAVSGDKDGLTADDKGSVVYKNLIEDNILRSVPTEEAAKWYYADDGYFYYAKALAGKTDENPGESTVKLLDSVTLCGNTDMGYFENIDVWKIVDKGAPEPDYTKDPDGWVSNEPSKTEMEGKDVYHYKANQLDGDREGYANAGYTLNITVEFIQADEEAAQAFPDNAKWNWWPGKSDESTAPGEDQGGEEVEP